VLKLISILFVLLSLTLQLSACDSGDESPFKSPNTGGGSGGGGGGGGGGDGGDDGDGSDDVLILEKLLNGSLEKLMVPIAGPTNVAYVSRSNIDGASNPTFKNQIFTHRADTVTQVTDFVFNRGENTQSIGAQEVVMSGDGTTIAYINNYDPLGTNADNGPELFLITTSTGAIQQVTNDTLTNNEHLKCILLSCITISDDASLVYFVSNADYVIGSNPNAFQQIFSITTNGSNTITQVSAFTATSSNTSIVVSGDNSRLAIHTQGNLLGNNADGSHEIYYLDTNDVNSLTQITATDNLPANDDHKLPVISTDGNIIVFPSGKDPLSSGTFILEIYSYNVNATTLVNVTSLAPTDPQDQIYDHYAVSGNGQFIYYNEQTINNGDANYGIMRSSTDGTLTAFVYATGALGSQVDILLDMHASASGDRVTFNFQDIGIYSVRP